MNEWRDKQPESKKKELQKVEAKIISSLHEAKNNKEIPDDVKKKYFYIFFEQNDFLLRPNEGMEESDFENELLDQISNKEQDCKGIIEKIMSRGDFSPNIKNNNGESILDKAIGSNYINTVVKILSDRRFNNIGLYSFKTSIILK